MKFFNKATMKKALLTCLAVFATTFCAALGVSLHKPATAKAETLSSAVYQTDGASVRVFEPLRDGNGNISYAETSKKGIRFHVEMGEGYVYGGKSVLNTAETYDRGSYKITEGFKTYTLVIPTRLLSGELSVGTVKVMAIDTTEYWFEDDDGNLESVAYIYNVPQKWYTDDFSYRGVICTVAQDGTETVVAQTEVEERSLTWVAKQAYNDTIDENTNYWGTAKQDDTAAPLIKAFVPTYNITYKVNAEETTEEVLWGDIPQNVPANVADAWYDTENSEEVNVTAAMTWTENRTLVLETTSSDEFVLTGVAAETDFEVDSTAYHGFKVYATLHTEAFEDKTQMDTRAVNVEHIRGEEVLCEGIELQGVWTMSEKNSLGETQMLLFFALDTSTLQNGDIVVIKGDSVFYANNIMYKLTEDYTINYAKTESTGSSESVESYDMFLGYLYNSDVKGITNCAEDNTGNNGAPNEFTVRVEFYEDVMINGEFTFEFGPDSDTTKYEYPVYIQCGEDESKLIPVSGGRYYWNEGNHKILELIGTGEYENKVFGWHDGDELIGAPGTIIKQNGGYYIFQDEMYSYFLPNGNTDTYGTVIGNWVVGDEVGQYTTSEFAVQGTVTAINDNGVPENEIRITTANHWFPENEKVSLLTTENMSDTEPYAVYRTATDGTITEIEKVRYHGTSNGEGGYFQILGFCDANDFAVGDVVTIAAGARFWLGTEYYTVTDKITYYYNGSFWAQNFDASTIGKLSSANFGERAHNQGDGELRMYFTAPLDGYTTTDGGAFDDLQLGVGSITLNGVPFTYVRYQRWDAGSMWLAFGGTGMIGKVAFGDKVVVEAGTTIWSANNVAYEFTEKVEWIYGGPNSANTSVTWSRVLGGVTVDATTTNASVSGVGTFAVGETYTLTATPNNGYLISAVIVNNKELPLNANNTYTFTVEQSNTIAVNAVVGYNVTFSVGEGALVDGGAITNGGFKTVADGGSLTFTVAASEGYKLTGVANATDNGNGTYTVSNVTAATTVTITTEKLYKVTYSGDNASVTADVANGAWVDDGTTVTLTIAVDSGYTLIGVENATKVNATTYTATVNGADLNVTATAKKADEFVDITDRLSMEDRTSWGADDNEVYVGLLDTGITNTVTNEDGTTSTNHYFNTSVNDTWYVGNDAPITANNGVDIMEYIYVNGTSARKLITDNANGVRGANSCACWLSNPAAYPVYVQTTNGSGLMMRFATAVFGTEFTMTIKAGFMITNADGDLVAITKDIHFNYANATITKEVITSQYTVTLDGVTGATVTANGSTVSNGASLAEGTEITITPSEAYNVSSVTVNGETLTANNGVYTFTLLKNTTISVSATIKTYTVTASCSGGVTADATSKTVNHGSSVTFDLTVPANATIKANGTVISGTSYTVSNVTANTPVTFTTWYNVTINADNATVSGITSGSLYESGSTVNFTVTPDTGHNLISVTGATGSGSNYSVTFDGNKTITVNTELKTYTITAETDGYVSITNGTSQEVQYGGSVTFNLSAPDSAIIKVNGTAISGTSYTVSNVTDDTTTKLTFTTWYTVTVTNTNNAKLTDLSNNMEVQVGVKYTFTVADVEASIVQQTGCTVNSVVLTGGTFSDGSTTKNGAGTYTASFTSKPTVTINATATQYDGGCLVEGTLITLADGTQKAVEDLKAGDMLLVFNHETGKYDVAPLLVNTHATAEADYYTVISLYFSNGEVLRIADEHAVFSKTANKYVYINASNAYEFIGHEFVSTIYENGEAVTKIVTLDNVTITEEYVRIFTPVSVWHMNLVADNMLTLSGRTTNFFEYDETMKYDEEKMQADIEKYGLYTYADFEEYVSEEVFNAFPFKYFKVAIEKGDYTWEELMFLLSEYNENDSEK